MRQGTMIASITVIAIALAALQFWNTQRPVSQAPLPAMARDLPKDVAQANRVFAQRVAQRFPAGTPGATIAAALAAAGFAAEANDGAWHGAVLKRRLPPCEVTWRVRWRDDAGNRVSETSGSYGLACP